MRMKDIRIGQLVMAPKADWRNPMLPLVGKVVDIAYEYDYVSLVGARLDREVRVLPLVHFLGEREPRTIAPCNIQHYRPTGPD